MFPVDAARFAAFDKCLHGVRRGKPIAAEFTRLQPPLFGKTPQVVAGKPVGPGRLSQRQKVVLLFRHDASLNFKIRR